MIKHKHYDRVKRYLELNLSPLLIGPAGTGKTTLAKQIADELGLPFESLSLTKQTSVGHMMGFKSVSGEYISTTFRDAYENGGVFLLDEVDAADPNALLCLNTVDNGYVSFPDKRVEAHPDFKLIATANPPGEGNIYTGRSKLDFASLNRFLPVNIDRDRDLEMKLTSKLTVELLDKARNVHALNGSSVQLTMRDAMRYDILAKDDPEVVGDPLLLLLGSNTEIADEMLEALNVVIINSKPLSDAKDISELTDMINSRSKKDSLWL